MATQIKSTINDVINHVNATGNSNIKFKTYPAISNFYSPVDMTSSIGIEIVEDTHQMFPSSGLRIQVAFWLRGRMAVQYLYIQKKQAWVAAICAYK